MLLHEILSLISKGQRVKSELRYIKNLFHVYHMSGLKSNTYIYPFKTDGLKCVKILKKTQIWKSHRQKKELEYEFLIFMARTQQDFATKEISFQKLP